MKRKIIIIVILLSILTMSSVTAKNLDLKGFKAISVLWNKEKLIPDSKNGSAVMLDNRVYIPAYLLRQANLSIQLNNNILEITDNKNKYVRNLSILNTFRRGYMDSFTQLDNEVLSLMEKVILKEDINTAPLLDLLDSVERNAAGFDYSQLAIINDRPDGLSHAVRSSESYKEAINSLIEYIKTNDTADLKAFYETRKEALEAYSLVKNEYDNYSNLSLLKAFQ
ncbi:hypothetical protein D3C76_802690 [compost metagenome]